MRVRGRSFWRLNAWHHPHPWGPEDTAGRSRGKWVSGARRSRKIRDPWETLKERMLSRHWENSLTSSCDSNICWVLGLSISFNSNAVHLLIEGESFWNPSNATNPSFYQKLLSDLLLFILWMVYQFGLVIIQRCIVIWNWQSRWIINGLWPNWLYKLNNLINYDSPSDLGSWATRIQIC